MTSKRFALVLTAFLGAGPAASATLPGPLQALPSTGPEVLLRVQATPADSPVTYASDQADRGEEEYAAECEECHGDDLRGGLNGGAPLRGVAFEQKYFDGLPASVLYSYMSSAMPPQSPGRLSANTYAELMAYVLKENGVQPGAPLPADLDALDQLIMQK